MTSLLASFSSLAKPLSPFRVKEKLTFAALVGETALPALSKYTKLIFFNLIVRLINNNKVLEIEKDKIQKPKTIKAYKEEGYEKTTQEQQLHKLSVTNT